MLAFIQNLHLKIIEITNSSAQISTNSNIKADEYTPNGEIVCFHIAIYHFFRI